VDLLQSIEALDEALLRSCRGSPAWALPLFVTFTFLGGGWGMIALVPFFFRQKTRDKATWLVLSIATTSLLVSLVKSLVSRVRPCDALAGCAAVFVSSPGGHSFPSGHAAGAFTFAAFVSLQSPRASLPAFAFAALVAWSRCFLGVHYPSDILAGALLGASIGLAFSRTASRRPAPQLRTFQLKLLELKRLGLKRLGLKGSSRNGSQ